MKSNAVKIKSIDKITHDVLKIVTEKPKLLTFIPGQATEVCVDKNNCKKEKGPFTSMPANDDLEFIIKTYPTHDGITDELLDLKKNDELILRDVFGAIKYKGDDVFIAGGAGVTPFVSIFRDLKSKNKIGNNKLIFANKTKGDIILEKEFTSILGDSFINILSDEKTEGYHHGLITQGKLILFYH
jgi:NAD(P)H-flavin reductase